MADGLDPLALLRCQQIDSGQRAAGIGGHGRQHALHPTYERFDARRVEHVGAEFDDAADTGGFPCGSPAFGQGEREIHACRLGLHGQRRDRQVTERQSALDVDVLPRQVLPTQHHLHQRMVRQRTRRVQALDQYLERHILVFVGRQAAGPHLRQKLFGSGVSGQVDTQHQGVDEEAHQIVEGGVPPPGDRKADGDIGTGAELGQHDGQRGLHDHEAGRIVFARHPRDLLLQLGGPVHFDRRALQIGDRRVGPVGRQVDAVGKAGQGLGPVGQLGRDLAVGRVEFTQLLALPQRVVDVLHGQRRPARRSAGTAADVCGAQIGDQRLQRPAVRGDVMHHGHQQVLVSGKPEQAGAHRDFGRQVEHVLRGFTHCGGALLVGPGGGVDDIPAELHLVGGQDHLPGCAIRRREHGPQALVPAHHVGQRRTQRLGIEATLQPEQHRHVVKR
ncbi:Uncharacterised protein [Mycobacteroides abscessus subsp. abscessus]|nr:Uncharacterised protein [Mycobacteroides abscessus subsp. abscessus]